MDELNKNSISRRAGGFKIPAVLLLAAGLTAFAVTAAAPSGQAQTAKKDQAAKPQDQWNVVSHDRTNFPLTGKHRTINCRDCHINDVFEGTPKACEVCHWERRQDDRYKLRLGTDCAECHTPQSWKKVDPAKWNHETVTGFKLEGVHQFLDCTDCHGTQGFAKVPTDCYSCHARDYLRTTNPDHAAAGFPTDCKTCHTMRSWGGAQFNHTIFVLQGRHKTAACTDCHKNGVYAGTPTDCASCHLADYNATTDPNHRARGYSLECQTCHGTSATSWSGAGDAALSTLAVKSGSFNHEFPITAGRHAGLICADCHVSSTYRQFNCLDCHAHDKVDMDKKHRRTAGYAYSSQACYACHPRGLR